MTAALLALVAAVVIGAGAVIQQDVARTEAPHPVMDPRLVLQLLRRKVWLMGVAVSIGGFALQATAIAIGSLVVVEPVLATNVMFALLIGARHHHQRLGRREWTGIVATVIGVGAFLAVADPSTTAADPIVSWALPIAGLTVVVVVGSVAASRMVPARRALTLALLAGIAFGFSDGLIKLISDVVGATGASGLATHWSLYAWLVISPTAFLLQQSAFHSGDLAAALPGTTSLQPTTASLLGAAMFGEALRGGWAVPLEVASVALVLFGVVTLARSTLIEGAEGSALNESELHHV